VESGGRVSDREAQCGDHHVKLSLNIGLVISEHRAVLDSTTQFERHRVVSRRGDADSSQDGAGADGVLQCSPLAFAVIRA
jgi:hypothetical protein